MTPALLLPAGLAALAAVLLPLLIHLARRSEQRPTVFAALQWLRQKPRPRHRIRFDEWPLLLVRLLLLALLALLLARPVLFGAANADPWVAVAPGVDPVRARGFDAPTDARWHWLTPGFPALDDVPAPVSAASARAPVTSLLRELDASLPPDVALTVIVPARLEGVDGQRPVLGRRVEWRVVPGAPPRHAAAQAAPPSDLGVRYASERADASRYLRAAIAAWRPPVNATARPPDVAPAAQPLPPPTRPLVWLVPGPVPTRVLDRIGAGGSALLDAEARVPGLPPMVALWRDADGATLVEGGAYGRGRLMRLTVALTPEQMPALLETDFPQRLRGLFQPSPPAPARVAAAAHAPDSGGPRFAPAPRDLQPWLLALIALLFLLERWLASGPRGRAGP